MRSRTDPLLILDPVGFVDTVPKDLLPFLATVRKASDWRLLGFSVDLDQYGFPVRDRASDCKFSIARENDSVIADAICTGKRAVRHPLAVFEYFNAGCELSEFANLPDDVAAFCKGKVLYIAGKAAEALPYIRNAVELNSNEVRYREIFYPLRLQLGDMSAIDEELNHYQSDMDSAIHSGRLDSWLKYLIDLADYDGARRILSVAMSSLQNLIDQKTTARLYGQQQRSWYEGKKEQLNKIAYKYLDRIKKLEKKKQ